MNLQQNFELEIYYAKTLYKLFEQKFYQNELRTTFCSRNVLGKTYYKLFEEKNLLGMNLEQNFELEMYHIKPSTKDLNKNSTRNELRT